MTRDGQQLLGAIRTSPAYQLDISGRYSLEQGDTERGLGWVSCLHILVGKYRVSHLKKRGLVDFNLCLDIIQGWA